MVEKDYLPRYWLNCHSPCGRDLRSVQERERFRTRWTEYEVRTMLPPLLALPCGVLHDAPSLHMKGEHCHDSSARCAFPASHRPSL